MKIGDIWWHSGYKYHELLCFAIVFRKDGVSGRDIREMQRISTAHSDKQESLVAPNTSKPRFYWEIDEKVLHTCWRDAKFRCRSSNDNSTGCTRPTYMKQDSRTIISTCGYMDGWWLAKSKLHGKRESNVWRVCTWQNPMYYGELRMLEVPNPAQGKVRDIIMWLVAV